MIFWIVCWAITLVIFMVPLCYTKERRQKIWNAMFFCWKNADSSRTETSPVSDVPETQEVFHYRLSRSQEDDIRESFLVDKLGLYTLEITESDITRRDDGRSDRSTEELSSSCTDPGFGDDYGEVNVVLENEHVTIHREEEEAEGVDIETGVGLSPPRKRTESTDNLSTSDISDEILEEFADYEGENQLVAIPIAGECRHDLLPESVCRTQRQVPNGCAICLSAFDVTDKVTWSSNPECSHVFHHSCILDWLQATGRKALRRRRRNEDAAIISYAYDPVSRLTKFPMLCPCCRQEFILQSTDEETSVEKDVVSASDEVSSPTVMVDLDVSSTRTSSEAATPEEGNVDDAGTGALSPRVDDIPV